MKCQWSREPFYCLTGTRDFQSSRATVSIASRHEPHQKPADQTTRHTLQDEFEEQYPPTGLLVVSVPGQALEGGVSLDCELPLTA